MTDIVKGMSAAFNAATNELMPDWRPGDTEWLDNVGLRAALLFLADNVSDEMAAASLAAFCNAPDETLVQDVRKRVISAAIRAAAGGGE